MSIRKGVSCHTDRDGVATFWEDGRRTFTHFQRPFRDSDVQLYPKRFGGQRPDYERDKYSPDQNAHYRLAVYGLATVPKDQLKVMSQRDLQVARRTFIRAQAELNRMKNEVLDKSFEKIIPKIFKETRSSNVVKALKENYKDCYNEPNSLTFSFLGITKEMIITRLTRVGILNPRVFQG